MVGSATGVTMIVEVGTSLDVGASTMLVLGKGGEVLTGASLDEEDSTMLEELIWVLLTSEDEAIAVLDSVVGVGLETSGVELASDEVDELISGVGLIEETSLYTEEYTTLDEGSRMVDDETSLLAVDSVLEMAELELITDEAE